MTQIEGAIGFLTGLYVTLLTFLLTLQTLSIIQELEYCNNAQLSFSPLISLSPPICQTIFLVL